ncbi:hypothetical protein [Sphingobium sp. EM0848]|uniref:hypothetical protein n=1 Tax=Sphingobium sp. EM0848 TaxID=2743473 RepID=UPI0021009D72|nr:hypothetical protein [Sphingobium sp. EM0848]
MNRGAFSRKEWMVRIVPQMEDWLARLFLPAVVAAVLLLFFTAIYRMVDDLLVAAVIAMVVSMIFLPLFRRQGAH